MTMGRFLVPLLLSLPAVAKATGQDAVLWTSVSASGPLGGGVVFTGDAQARIGSGPQDFRQYLIRVGLGTSLGHHVTAHAGYAYFRTGRPGRLSDEHRAWQQVAYPFGSVGKVSLHGRTRLEQRFFEDTDGASWRLRQQLRATAPLGTPRQPSIVLATEGLFNLNAVRGAPRSGLDRWRGQAGLSIPLGRGISFEPSYLNQYVRRRGQDLDEHILITGLSARW